jgi:hypothetical protein
MAAVYAFPKEIQGFCGFLLMPGFNFLRLLSGLCVSAVSVYRGARPCTKSALNIRTGSGSDRPNNLLWEYALANSSSV